MFLADGSLVIKPFHIFLPFINTPFHKLRHEHYSPYFYEVVMVIESQWIWTVFLRIYINADYLRSHLEINHYDNKVKTR